MKQKKITYKKYEEIINKILDKGLPVHEALIEMINTAGKYKIIDTVNKKPKKKK